MRKTNKKGFTIVELVVVIAVIAILAAVLIPTFSGIIKKANLSKDQQAIANMNKVVAEEASLDEFDYAGDAVNALYAHGYNVGKLQAFTKDHHYAYSLETNTFYLLDEDDAIIFPKNADVEADTLWGFFNNSKADVITTVTKYVALSAISNDATFGGDDCAFAGTTKQYTLDLNNRYIGLAGKANVTLVNGTVKAGSSFTKGTDVAEKTVYAPANNAITGEVKDAVIASTSNKTYTSTGAVVFKNTTLDFTASSNNATATFKGADSYVFENCVINMNDANVFIETNGATDITFKNCYITSGRGIVIGGAGTVANGNKFGDIVFEGNTFVCTNQSLNRPFIQFAGSKAIHSLTADAITIKNNVFECSDIVVRIHESLTALNCSAITLTGNTFNEAAVKVDGDGASAAQAIADSKFKF
ncbi:MAG: type II secretion system protein [Clostridia bacterium]|nr:type II secretion system protein [Clostridia bacterium]